MKQVYLVRHGETTYNRDHLVQDGSSLLTEAGERQAQQVAERLRDISFDHLIVSDYERTKQTAAPIAERSSMAPVYSPLWREIRRPSSFLHTDRRLDAYQSFLATELEQFAIDEHWRHSDEESFTDVSKRVEAALEMLLAHEGDVAVVSHGHFIRRIVATIALGGTIDGSTWQKMYNSMFASNTGVTKIMHDGERWYLLTFNDHAHVAV